MLLRKAEVGLKQPPHKAQVTWARRAQKTGDREKKEIRHMSRNRQFLVTAPNEALSRSHLDSRRPQEASGKLKYKMVCLT